jgi:hypothetical protein
MEVAAFSFTLGSLFSIMPCLQRVMMCGYVEGNSLHSKGYASMNDEADLVKD